MQMRKILLYFALKYKGNYKEIYEAIKRKEPVTVEDLAKVESQIKSKYVTIVDPAYPSKLKNIGTPPIILFYYGNLDLMNSHNIMAIIGNREFTPYGQEITEKIVAGLKDYSVITISGLAIGIDAIAHKASLDNNIPTIAVLGGGIDYCYPNCNQEIYDRIKENGLIISEYPNDIVPKPDNFLVRNRIIAGLSDGIVVTEAKYKSGTMNTVAYGLEFGKDIFAVPNLANIGSGCNYLIKQGATLIESAKDIFD